MDVCEAETAARKWLASNIDLRHCTGPKVPRTFYNFDPAQHHVFLVTDLGQFHIGGDRYIAVNKQNGSVIDLGYSGE